MNSNATQNISISDPFVPTDVSVYDLNVNITMDDADANTSDNSTDLKPIRVLVPK